MRLLEFYKLQIVGKNGFFKRAVFSISSEIKNRGMQRHLTLLADILYDKMCVKSKKE